MSSVAVTLREPTVTVSSVSYTNTSVLTFQLTRTAIFTLPTERKSRPYSTLDCLHGVLLRQALSAPRMASYFD